MSETIAPPASPTDRKNEDVPGKNQNYYETLSDTGQEKTSMSTSSPKSTSSTSLLSKKDRKKLKKLKKRAALVLIESERSGLLTRSEYDEYRVLSSKEDTTSSTSSTATSTSTMIKLCSSSSTTSSFPLACPSINLRKKCLGIEKAEGVTHRDLLSWLLQQKFDGQQQAVESSSSCSSSKKRPRDEDDSEENKKVDTTKNTILIPHWASIHNPSTCEQVAVLEIHVPDDKIEPYSQFLESCRSKNDTKDNENKESATTDHCFPHSQVGIATKWFQGHMPKSMSESLLYFSTVKKEHRSKTGKKNEDESIIPSKTDLIERLETMLLSVEEMNDQGYPKALSSSIHKETTIVTNNEALNVASRKEKFESPDSISLETAKSYIGAFGLRVEDQNEEDESAYIKTPLTASSADNLDNKPNGDVANDDECPVRVLGLDCEMVLTTLGSELARVTLVQFDEFVGPKINSKTTVLMDCLVLPNNRIVDYLTKHSGITQDLLKPISTRLEQVQYALACYLTPNDVLIGHSLENDLRALHYIHPRVVDTSMIFRPTDQNKRFKFSLRHLSGTLLNKQIQNGSHCSEEDAQTALDLALLKALKGDDLRVPGFGDNQRQSLLRQKFVKDSVAAFIGPNSWLEAHITKHPNGAHALSYDSPKDCKKAMLAWMTNSRKAQLIWSKIELRNESNSSGCGSEASFKIFKSLVVSF